jgi:nicotinamidase-related amidase
MRPLDVTTALVIIDVQDVFDEPRWGPRNNPDAEANIARLLHEWRRTGRPIFHVRHLSPAAHSSFHVSHAGSRIKQIVHPLEGEPVIEKSVNSAFIGTNLEDRLHRAGITGLLMTGLTSNHCVETTTRMGGNLGFDTYFVSDATATFDRRGPDGVLHTAEEIHSMTLSNLNDEFATIVDTGTVLSQSRTNGEQEEQRSALSVG